MSCMSDEIETLLTSKEASQVLKIHPKVLERMAKRGEVPALKVGKFWRYRASDSVRQGLRRLQFVCLQGFPLPVQFGGIFANLFGGLTLLVSDTIISVI